MIILARMAWRVIIMIMVVIVGVRLGAIIMAFVRARVDNADRHSCENAENGYQTHNKTHAGIRILNRLNARYFLEREY